MHRVERGPEPGALSQVRSQYTPRWVQYYRQGIGNRPTDSHWLSFRTDLRQAFFDLCVYCEELTPGEVDHFKPKHKYPELVYDWTNWVLACHDCNHSKHDKWPAGGLVNPCANSIAARPENMFEFDTLTGGMRPKAGLSKSRHQKAQSSIDSIGLDGYAYRKKRLDRFRLVSMAIAAAQVDPTPELLDFISYLADRATQFSSFTRVILTEHGFTVKNESPTPNGTNR